MANSNYIGLGLAVAGSVAIGSSFIITKQGLNRLSREQNESAQGVAYLRSPMWWAGTTTMVLGEVANFAAYMFAPPIMVTPLGCLSVLIGAILASIFLNEKLDQIGWVACALTLVGSMIIVLHAPPEKEVASVDEMIAYALAPGFLLYCIAVLFFSLYMLRTVAPKYGKSSPLVYISVCSLVGSVSIMAIKGVGVALKLTLEGNSQLARPSLYIFGFVAVSCALLQTHYVSKALGIFDTNIVNPMYFVGFSTSTLVASLVLYQGFGTAGARDTIALLAGFVVTFLGVHLLNVSRSQGPLLEEYEAVHDEEEVPLAPLGHVPEEAEDADHREWTDVRDGVVEPREEV